MTNRVRNSRPRAALPVPDAERNSPAASSGPCWCAEEIARLPMPLDGRGLPVPRLLAPAFARSGNTRPRLTRDDFQSDLAWPALRAKRSNQTTSHARPEGRQLLAMTGPFWPISSQRLALPVPQLHRRDHGGTTAIGDKGNRRGDAVGRRHQPMPKPVAVSEIARVSFSRTTWIAASQKIVVSTAPCRRSRWREQLDSAWGATRRLVTGAAAGSQSVTPHSPAISRHAVEASSSFSRHA